MLKTHCIKWGEGERQRKNVLETRQELVMELDAG